MVEGSGKHTCYRLGAPRIVLGRETAGQNSSSELFLFSEPTVSKVHAVLEWDTKRRRYVVTNHSSTNPTLVNGQKISRSRALNPGDQLRMGNLLVELRIGVGQHVDEDLQAVDVASLIRATRATEPAEAVQWVANTPIVAQPEAATPLPTYLFEPSVAAAPFARSVSLESPETELTWQEIAQESGLELAPHWECPDELVEEAPEVETTLVEPETDEVPEGEPVQDEAEPTVREEALPPEPTEPSRTPDAAASEPTAEPSTAPEEAAPTPAPKQKPYRRATRKIGRNERCPCGSGLKYKKCCGR